jgi:hypothetical protein
MMEGLMIKIKRDIDYWDGINWTEFEQIELEIQEGELIDVYAKVGETK